MTSFLLWTTVCCLLIFPLSTVNGCEEEYLNDCYYTLEGNLRAAHCQSLELIHKLCPNSLAKIKSLDISNSKLTIISKKFRKLKNLEKLDVSNNALTDLIHISLWHFNSLKHLNVAFNLIKSFSGKQLPPKIEELNIAYNNIMELPQDLLHIHTLKSINVTGNIFTCSRGSLDVRDGLIERNVKIIGRALCHKASKFPDQTWSHVVDFDEFIKVRDSEEMQGDEPGSGDFEGSGQFDVFEKPTTSEPINNNDDFIFGPSGSGAEELLTTLEPDVASPPNIDENEGSGEIYSIDDDDEEYRHINESFSTEDPVQTPITTESSILGNVEANKADTGSLGANIFLVFILICLVALLVYAIKKNNERKRKNARRNTSDPEKETGIELIPKSNIPNEKQNGNTESAPLINGNSPKDENEVNENKVEKDSYSPVELRNEDKTNTSPRNSGGGSPYLNIPPDVVSVKVRASEIPDSVPLTPILVERRQTRDGQTVITPNLNQSVSSSD